MYVLCLDGIANENLVKVLQEKFAEFIPHISDYNYTVPENNKLYGNNHIFQHYLQRKIRGAVDKSLARPTSRCRRTESIVSLERGIWSCAELHVLSCYRGWKEACQATRAISTTSRRELSPSFFFLGRQGAEGNSRHSERNIRGTCTIACHRQTQESLVHISLMRKSYKQPIPTHDGE